MKRFVVGLLATMVLGAAAWPSAVSPRGAGEPATATQDGVVYLALVEREVDRLTNAERASLSLPVLLPEATLRDVARQHSANMLANGFFAHVDPSGFAPQHRVGAAHRRAIAEVGENVFQSRGVPESELAGEIVGSLLSSPPHRRNILRADYTHTAVGVAMQGDAARATQVFARIVGMIDQDVPAVVRAGHTLRLTARTNSGRAFDRIDVWDLRRDAAAMRAVLPTQPIVFDLAAGTYQLRFYVAETATEAAVYRGPVVEVR